MRADVVIVGGGLAGLAAAIKLVNSGAKVVILEKNSYLGGRTYSFLDSKTGDIVDNGQHVLVGAYYHTLEYLKTIGTLEFLKRQNNPHIYFYDFSKGLSRFNIPNLPAPLNLLSGLLNHKMLPMSDRLKMLKVGMQLMFWNKQLENELLEMSVAEWLERMKQSEVVKKSFWYPIMISALNESPEIASALLFARIIKHTFLNRTANSEILIPTIGQSELYIDSAIKFINDRKSSIVKNSYVKALIINKNEVSGVEAKEKVIAGNIILAIPHYNLLRLLQNNFINLPELSNLKLLGSSPIISINLWFDREVMEQDFIGVIDGNLQWIFNKRNIMYETNNNYISAVISNARSLIDQSKNEIIKIALRELMDIFPKVKSAELLHYVVLKERRATFSASNVSEKYRPLQQTSIKNLYICGDWTNTGLPATIEGAIKSGFNCAELICKSFI